MASSLSSRLSHRGVCCIVELSASCGASASSRPAPGGGALGATTAIARGVTTCLVKAVKAWLQTAGISEGPLFRPVAKGCRLSAERLTDQSVCKIVKAYAERIGLKAADFGAHSLPRRLPDQCSPP